MHAMLDTGAMATVACTQFAAAATCASAKLSVDNAHAFAPCLATNVASAADATSKLALMSASVAMATATTATGFAHKLLDTAADRAQAAYAAAEDAAAGIKAAHEVKVPDGVAAPHALEPAEAVEPMVPVPIRPHRQKASYDPDRRGNPDAWPPQPPADADATVSYRALY